MTTSIRREPAPCNTSASLPDPGLSEVILRIFRIEVGVYDWRAEVQGLVPVVLNELVILVIDSDPDQNLALDILVDDIPATVVVLYSLLWEKPLPGPACSGRTRFLLRAQRR